MLVKLDASHGGNLGFLASGRLTENDYLNFLIPEVEKAITEHGKIRLLFQMEDFSGWDHHALWKDFTFGMRINSSVEKIALVGDKTWEEWVAKMVKVFCQGDARYFALTEVKSAWIWLQE